MISFIEGMGMTYLLWPILGLILVGVGMMIAKKNDLLSNKRLIGGFVGAVIALTLPALLGMLDYAFMPYGYMLAMLLYMMSGCINLHMVAWVFNEKLKYRHEIIYTLFLTVVSMLMFTLVFNLCNDLKYGLWASTPLLSLPFVSLFRQSYKLYLYIPTPIYKMWKFSDSESVDMYANIDYERLKVVSLELYRQEGDKEPICLKGKVPDEIPFGVWVKRIIEDYNKKKPDLAIVYKENDKDQSWIFYKHNSVFLPKRYLDCSLTVSENRIRENCFIVGKRVKEYITTEKNG